MKTRLDMFIGLPAGICRMESEGYVIIRGYLPPEKQHQFRDEIWALMEGLPRRPAFHICRPRAPLLPLDNTTQKLLEQRWPPHKETGALHEPPVFHLPSAWMVRQDPGLYRQFSQLMGTERLWCHLDQVSLVLPGHGETHELSWEADPWFWTVEDEWRPERIEGRLFLSDGPFWCTPGSHKNGFIDWWKAQHPEAAPTKGRRASVPLKDQMATQLDMQAGDLLLWHPHLAREQRPNPGGSIWHQWKLGMSRIKPSMEEKADRLESYYGGRAPSWFPNGQPVNYMPRRWSCYWRLAANYQLMLPSPLNQEQRTTQSGSNVASVSEYEPANYQPPPLTLLGKRLLGEEPWPTTTNSDLPPKKRHEEM